MNKTLTDFILSNIKAKTKTKGITREQLAERMHVSRDFIFSKFSKRKTLKLDELPEWAEALGCSVCDLLYDPESDNKNICTEAEVISNKISTLPPKHRKLILIIVDLICKLITLSHAENGN